MLDALGASPSLAAREATLEPARGLYHDQLAFGRGKSLWSSPSPLSAGLRVCTPRAGKNFKLGDLI